jgi:hypothetical protein
MGYPGKYTDVVFLQGDDYDAMIGELFPDLEEAWSPRGLIESEPERVMAYLARWDCGEVGEVRVGTGAGSADDVYPFPAERYVMSVNTSLGYAGLVRRLEEE